MWARQLSRLGLGLVPQEEMGGVEGQGLRPALHLVSVRCPDGHRAGGCRLRHLMQDWHALPGLCLCIRPKFFPPPFCISLLSFVQVQLEHANSRDQRTEAPGGVAHPGEASSPGQGR